MSKIIVATDLDGTLLDHSTYDWRPAAPALAELKKRRIPLIFCSSKTRAEMRALQIATGVDDPLIPENGASGAPIAEVRATLAEAARRARSLVRGFGEMTLEEIATSTGLPPETAALAAQREFDEPFLFIEGDPQLLLREIRALGYQSTRGGRFFHIFKSGSKGRAFLELAQHYDLRIALGDSENDRSLLDAAHLPILIPGGNLSPQPNYRVAPQPGPSGWNAALLDILAGL